MKIAIDGKVVATTPPQTPAEDTVYWWVIGQPIRNNRRVPRIYPATVLVDLRQLGALWSEAKKVISRVLARMHADRL